MLKCGALLSLIVTLLVSCSSSSNGSITQSDYGKLPDGSKVSVFKLVNSNGVEASILDYGGIVTSLKVPDRVGNMADVVCGYNKLEDYLKWTPYYGCLVGRFGNRIANGKFSLDGKEYTLVQNNEVNCLHGGTVGFDKVIWKARAYVSKVGPALELKYLSKHMEEGFPGNLNVTATYYLTNDNELKLVYKATTDKKTVINLTHHSYFNLSGPSTGDILDHEVVINADHFLPVNEVHIPNGEIKSVAGTPFDFRKPHKIGARIGNNDLQLKRGTGYDHNWVVNKKGPGLTFAASAYDAKSGRLMEVFTDKPGIQLYTGNFLEKDIGKEGKPYKFRYAFCMEPQDFPDAPNHKNFPSSVLNPGETYEHTIIYRFSAK